MFFQNIPIGRCGKFSRKCCFVFYFLKSISFGNYFLKSVFLYLKREKTFHTLDQTWPRFSLAYYLVENAYQPTGMDFFFFFSSGRVMRY